MLDTDGFVIPSLGIEDTYQTKPDASEVETLKPPPPKAKIDQNIYLGPHGAPPSQSKQQELNSSGRKQRFKHKLKEADKKVSRTGGENKVENLRELVGVGKVTENIAKGSPSDWLDPHCNESQFELSLIFSFSFLVCINIKLLPFVNHIRLIIAVN